MEKHRQALPPSLLPGHRNDLSVRYNRGKWRMTEMQWSCKTTKFHITQLCLLFSASGRTGCYNGMPGPDYVSVCRYFLFCFPQWPMIFAVSVCHLRPGPRWSPLSWQTFEVSQADTNIEHHHPHPSHKTFSWKGTWFNLFWSSLYLSNLLLSPPPILCSWWLLFLHGH